MFDGRADVLLQDVLESRARHGFAIGNRRPVPLTVRIYWISSQHSGGGCKVAGRRGGRTAVRLYGSREALDR